MRRRFITALVLALTISACSDRETLGESEASAINTIFKTGVTFERDPFVRAETFRVIELIGDPALADYADDGIADPSPMVRLASLRATLATDGANATSAAKQVFSRGTDQERRIILGAVAEYDEGPSRRELLGRALRSQDPELRRLAFDANFIERIDKAIASGDTDELERNLYPELGRYIGLDKDPVLAALAAEKFVAVGQTDRLDPLLKALNDPDAKLERRLTAARILVAARAEPAREHFNALIEQHAELLADNSIAVPDRIVPPELLRLAVLGSVATGDETHVKRAQKYIDNVPEHKTLEVLDALAANPSPEAAVSLKVAMQDARRSVRLRAIELYRSRDDADHGALISSLKGADYETQMTLAAVLFDRFQKEWSTSLRSQVQRTSEMERTLELLRDFVTTEEKAQALLLPLEDVLQKLIENEKGRRAALSAYLLAITNADTPAAKTAVANLDEPTRYAYLEFLVRTAPEKHVETFRNYLYDDMFVVRLMSAAGLWGVFGSAGAPEAEPANPTEAPEPEG